MQLDMKKLIEEEERRLKVGDPEFLKRHDEIMKRCDDLEEGQHCNRNSPQRLKNSPRMDFKVVNGNFHTQAEKGQKLPT